MRKFRTFATTLATIASTLLFSSSAYAQWTISKPGSYKLNNNHNVASGDGIIITASNVKLDLNGFAVSTTAGGGRGIVVQGAKNVSVSGGRVGGFMMNVLLADSESTVVEKLHITGRGLAPAGGPSEIGLVLVNSRASLVSENVVSSVNLGMLIRGPKATGNRLINNIITGGAVAANNLLGICYNPAPTPAGGAPDPAGPRGDGIYNNHIARFGYAFAVSSGSVSNIFTDNTVAPFVGAFREPELFTAQGGTNVEFDNAVALIPATDL
jgi:hypothetical protein